MIADAFKSTLLLALAVSMMPASAAELKVASAEAPRTVLETVAAGFSRSSGNTVTFAFLTAGQVRDRVMANEPIDLAVSSPAMIAELIKAQKVAAGVSLGRIGLAVAIGASAPVPDISTPEAFKQAVLSARAVAFTDPKAGGTAGIYFAGLLERLNIADAVAKKTVYGAGGRDVAEKVANGEAEIGITLPSEIMPIKGARIAGLLPDALQNYVIYTGAIVTASANGAVAKAYLDALLSPASREMWTQSGFEPPGAK